MTSIQTREQANIASIQRWRTQPLKGLCIAFAVLTLFIRVPYYALISLFNPLRSSFKKSLFVRLLRHFDWLANKSGLAITDRPAANYDKIATGSVGGESIKGVWVEPVPHLITGHLEEWGNVASVVAVRLPGYWIHGSDTSLGVGAKPRLGEKVAYVLHGGAYAYLSAHPGALSSAISRGLITHCDSVQRAFAIEYRLSVGPPYTPRNPFPTALIDALAGYNYLVNTVGFSPKDIVIVGDSAGGNLALALTRYLVEYQNVPGVLLPSPPGSLILVSPWADMGIVHVEPGSSTYTNLNSDIFSVEELLYPILAFTGPHGIDVVTTNEYMSPASQDVQHISFAGFPKTLIISGGAEVLRDQIRTLYDRMVKDMGSDVVHYESKDAIHIFICFDWFEPQRTEGFQVMGKWVSAL